MRPPRDVVLDYLRRLESGDVSAMDEVVDPDVVVYKPSGEVAFRERTSWKAALSERRSPT